jgi:enoyl-CoA hydratase
MEELILYSVADRVGRITLNRPEKRNALSLALRRQIVDALREAERDDAVTVVLIDGAGPSFCAGYDLADPRADKPAGWLESEHFD